MSSRGLLSFAAFLILSSLAISQAVPAAGPVEIFPLSKVKAGMKATGFTVFEGTVPEPFEIEIVGVLKNVWGPKQDIILVRVGGKAGKTGVAAGMSGSPVYIDGKLLGALSLRFGAFPNDNIGGVTPADLMLEINEIDASRPATQVASLGKLPLPEEVKGMLQPSLATNAGADAFMTPIETPLSFTGFNESVLRTFADTFKQMGVTVAMGGASGGSLSDVKPTTDPDKLRRALRPGAAVAGVLISGDLAVAGSGTVTYNDGRRVLAFGHPLLNFGKVDMPMASAEVVTTFGSPFQPFKIMNSIEAVGVLRQDRHSGIMGVLGESAHMIPVEATIHAGGKTNVYHYEVFQNAKFTPFMLTLATFNTLSGVNVYGDDLTYKVKANFQLQGYPEVKLEQLYAAPENSPAPAPLTLSFWLADRFGRMYLNSFETPTVTGIKLDFDLIPERKVATIEHVWLEKTEVRPGEEVAARIFLRPYRGERKVLDVKLRVPTNAPKGEMRVQFSDADYVNRYSSFLLQQNRAPGLKEIVALLNREHSNGQLFITMLHATPTAFVEDKVLPSIPSSVASVMDSGRVQNRLTMMGESSLQQESIPVDFMVSGNQTIVVTVK